MARKTNKAQALELAAQLGVEVEYGRMGDDGFEVALYGYAAHMAFDPMGEGHTSITNQAGTGARTESRIWGMALADLKEFVPCADNCHCRTTADADLVMTDAEPDGFEVALAGVGVRGDDEDAVVTDDGDAPRLDTVPCPVCFPHRGWAHGDESRRKQRDYCRSCLGSGVLRTIPADLETVTTRYYVITDDDTDAEYTGSVIGNCEPFEAMRTMIGIVRNVSRETVRIWETDNHREYGYDAPHGRRGTARFLSVVETPLNPYRPAPVTLTHSNLRPNS